jgi:hypothetical protein
MKFEFCLWGMSLLLLFPVRSPAVDFSDRAVMTFEAKGGMSKESTGLTQPRDFERVIRDFAAARHDMATNNAVRFNVPFPAEAELFFRAAETGTWEMVSNRFDRLKPSGDYGPVSPALRNGLWASVHETFGIWEIWEGWKHDSALLAMVYEPIMAGLPKGSIYFGGTDYGRFVITTASALRNPPPLYVITQNALADNTYLDHVRALYGTSIWVPSLADSAAAFQRYVDEVKSGVRKANSQIKMVNGRVTVAGVAGVMELNGILAGMIVEHNKDAHPFFVEESYIIEWMYPYLQPHGLVMSLNPSKLDRLPEDVIARDTAFWAEYEKKLFAQPTFETNTEARKAFSKMRTAIAGLYAYRKLNASAVAAFQQAIRLYPDSPEAFFRLAKLYEEAGQFTDAVKTLEAFIARKPPFGLEKAEEYLKALREGREKLKG